MRIFLSSQQALRPHAVPAYAFWEYYFKNALAEAGHEVLEAPGVDWAEGLTALPGGERARWLDRTWTKTVEYLRQEHARRPVGLFLGYLFPDQVEPAAVRALSGLGIPTVNFFCDNVREFTRVPASYRPFDLHWVPEAEALTFYRSAGLSLVHAPMPVWVPPAFRTIPSAEDDLVIFLGSHDDLREDLLGEAVGLGLPLRLHGDGWLPGAGPVAAPPAVSPARRLRNQFDFIRRHGLRGLAMRATYHWRRPRPRDWIKRHWQPALRGEAYFRGTRESAVVIGINRYPSFRHSFSHPHCYSRLRDIEAPMLGACYLAEWAPGLDDLYEPGVELETYRDAAELVHKAAELRRDPARRRSLRERGQRRALADHTIARSLERVTQALGSSVQRK